VRQQLMWCCLAASRAQQSRRMSAAGPRADIVYVYMCVCVCVCVCVCLCVCVCVCKREMCVHTTSKERKMCVTKFCLLVLSLITFTPQWIHNLMCK
jgi:amino acid permease